MGADPPAVGLQSTVGNCRAIIYLDGISTTWQDKPSKDRRSDRRITRQNSLLACKLVDCDGQVCQYPSVDTQPLTFGRSVTLS